MCPKVGIIFNLMCPRWALFSNFKLAGHIQKRKYRNNCRGNVFFLYFSGPIAVDLTVRQMGIKGILISAAPPLIGQERSRNMPTPLQH